MELSEYVRAHPDGVVSTLGADGAPQSAYLAIAATDSGELVFDARPDSRKVANLRRDPRISAVIGGPDGTTFQCEGVADFPADDELARCTAAYLEQFPQFAGSIGSGVVVIRMTVLWSRFGDYRS